MNLNKELENLKSQSDDQNQLVKIMREENVLLKLI
jgi:hypothetical protein